MTKTHCEITTQQCSMAQAFPHLRNSSAWCQHFSEWRPWMMASVGEILQAYGGARNLTSNCHNEPCTDLQNLIDLML